MAKKKAVRKKRSTRPTVKVLQEYRKNKKEEISEMSQEQINKILGRSGRGQDAIFRTPQSLVVTFIDYVNFNNARTDFDKKEWKTENGELVTKVTRVILPLSWMGFCVYCGVSTQYFNDFKTKKTYLENPDFAVVIQYIKDMIGSNQLAGAGAGIFNANIIMRVLNLKDSIEITGDREKIGSAFPTQEEFEQQQLLLQNRKEIDETD